MARLSIISLNQTQVLDTGAEVTATFEDTYRKLQNVTLHKANKVHCGPANLQLSVIGKFTGTLSHKTTLCEQEIFVVKNLKTNLLGLPAITELRLVERLHTICTSPGSIKHSCPDL